MLFKSIPILYFLTLTVSATIEVTDNKSEETTHYNESGTDSVKEEESPLKDNSFVSGINSFENSVQDSLNVTDQDDSKDDVDSNNEIDQNTSKSGPNSDENEGTKSENEGKVYKEPGFDLTPAEMKKFKIWKDGIVPYYIDVVSFSDKVTRDSIRSFLQSLNSMTSLNFVELHSPPADDDTRWVFFTNRRSLLGCADHFVGDFTNKGVQKVVLGYDCMARNGELAAAAMSIAGVPAQHNDPRRDKYITVNTENVMPDKMHLFEKLENSDWLFHDLEYDFNSITHFDYNKYSVNGRATIKPKVPEQDLLPGISLSPTDVLKINMLYNYVTKNNKLGVTECKKLFKPSGKFHENKAEEKIKPRKKPGQYLDRLKSNFYSKDLLTGIETKADRDFGLQKKPKYIDVLSYLSDYQTDDNRKKKQTLIVPSYKTNKNSGQKFIMFRKPLSNEYFHDPLY